MQDQNDPYYAIRDKQRRDRAIEMEEKSPNCNNDINGKNCGTKTLVSQTCNDYVCPECGVHYSTSGSNSEMRYCAMCGWNKQNFSEADAGESWDEECY